MGRKMATCKSSRIYQGKGLALSLIDQGLNAKENLTAIMGFWGWGLDEMPCISASKE